MVGKLAGDEHCFFGLPLFAGVGALLCPMNIAFFSVLQAVMNARGPGPSPGSPCRLSPMDHPSPPVTGDGPPPPPPPAPPRTKFGKMT